MIENISSWAKSIVLAIIVVSILEMILPNNKTKKYIKMVMGIFILYNVISPFIKNQNSISFADVDLENYESNTTNTFEIDQSSMDKRLEELYIEEIEKDITKKVEKQGYIVKSCKVKAKISENEEDTGITKISLKVDKNKEAQVEKEESDDSVDLENKMIDEIQKIKKIDTSISKEKETNDDASLEKSDIQNLKKFLIEEYEVNEKCLEIN